MKVEVIGLGYIGLPTAAVIASKGIQVVGFDIDQNIVDIVNLGEIHIVEKGLNSVVKEVVLGGNLRATTICEAADIFLISVPTPFNDNYEPDLKFIKSAINSIAPILQKGNLVILESTSPVGTTEQISIWLGQLRPDLKFPELNSNSKEIDVNVAYCPERVLPGKILIELKQNTRTIGGLTQSCSQRAKAFYELFVESKCYITDCRTAELTKLVENAFRDVNIAFANELSVISDRLNINVWNLIKLANLHPRVNILQPGPGVGGHCIAVDPWFIVNSAPSESRLIKTARLVNDSKPEFVVQKIQESVKSINKTKKILACLGLTYKPDIDDIRESPAISIVKRILDLEIEELLIVENNIKELPFYLKKPNVSHVDLYDALDRADIIVLLVDHADFKVIDMEMLRGKEVIDTRGVWSNNSLSTYI